MLNKNTIEKIKKACELHGGKSMMEKWEDGTITIESISRAYDRFVDKKLTESFDPEVDFCATFAIACYKMAVKNGEL